jgi:hypothetical protein
MRVAIRAAAAENQSAAFVALIVEENQAGLIAALAGPGLAIDYGIRSALLVRNR